MRTPLSMLAIGLMVSACSATMSPAASKIHVHTQISTALDSCKKLGPVRATYKMRPFVDSDQFLFAALREGTARLGGDSLALLQRDEIGSDAVRHGIAYRCF